MVLLSTVPFAFFLLFLGLKDIKDYKLPESTLGLLWGYFAVVLAGNEPFYSFYAVAFLAFFWLIRIIGEEMKKWRFLPKNIRNSMELGFGDVIVLPPLLIFGWLEFGLPGAVLLLAAFSILGEFWGLFGIWRFLGNQKKKKIPLVFIMFLSFMLALAVSALISHPIS